MSGAAAIEFLAFGSAGLVLGLAHFAALRANVRLYAAGGSLWQPVALNLARLTATAGAFLAAAVFGGALPTLAGLGGFLLARAVAVRTGWSSP